MQLPPEVHALARRQAWVVSRAQAVAAGLSVSELRTLVDSRRWQRPLRGVFVTHNSTVTYLTRVWAALLYAGSGALASHETAAYLARMLDAEPVAVRLTVPSNRRVHVSDEQIKITYLSPVALRRDPLRRPPMTPPAQTLLDLVVEARSADQVVGLIAAACQRRLVTPSAVRTEAARRRKVRWRDLVEEMCNDAASGVESPLERRYFHGVEIAHGLPTGLRQSVSRLPGTMYRHDVYYDEYELIVELDGIAYHQGPRATADLRRDNKLIATGRLVLRYRWADVVGSPCDVAREVAAALRLRGWKGTFRTCPRCHATR